MAYIGFGTAAVLVVGAVLLIIFNQEPLR
jgi:hypothetical protein